MKSVTYELRRVGSDSRREARKELLFRTRIIIPSTYGGVTELLWTELLRAVERDIGVYELPVSVDMRLL